MSYLDASPTPFHAAATAAARLVDEGGFSVVYRAEHIIWKQHVALKCFNALANVPAHLKDELLQAFIQEGKLMTSLSSRTAAIVQARDVGSMTVPQTGQVIPYMVLEWLDGRPLDKVLVDERQRGVPARSIFEVLALLEPVASALDVVHAQNIAHRDIKPANLFVIGDPRGVGTFVKILDFGIAKVMAEHAPAAFAAANNQANRIAMSWTDDATNEVSYQIERCTGTGCADFALLVTLPANT